MTKLTPYQRIMRAADKGVGMRLSAEECFQMSTDTAISHLAELDDSAMPHDKKEDDND